MFNWTYFILLTFAGFYSGFVGHSQNQEIGNQPLWTLTPFASFTAGLIGLAAFVFAVWSGFTFGFYWFAISIGEIILGAFLSGVVKATVR